jgi:hypothetical protein
MKYYITADVHGFYTEFRKVLDEAGYFTAHHSHSKDGFPVAEMERVPN